VESEFVLLHSSLQWARSSAHQSLRVQMGGHELSYR